MINKVIVTNHLGAYTTMELRFPEKSGFLIYDIDGLDPVKSDINTIEVSTRDGSNFNSARTGQRNIVFSIIYVENMIYEGLPYTAKIEELRHKTYKYFPIKRRIEMVFESDERSCKTYGYVESNEVDIFSKQEGSIISVICPDPNFYSLVPQATAFNSVEPNFEFPFSNESLVSNLLIMGNIATVSEKTVLYTGDVPVGVVIYIHAVGAVNNLTVLNLTSQQTMAIDSTILEFITGSDIVDGDDIIISTVKGDKFIKLIRNGVTYNIQNTLGQNTGWFELEKGYNTFGYTANGGVANLKFRIENRIAYEGV